MLEKHLGITSIFTINFNSRYQMFTANLNHFLPKLSFRNVFHKI